MIFKAPSEVCFYITDNFPVYWYGIIVAFSCFVGVFVSYKLYKKLYPYSKYEKILDIASWSLILGILGARLYYCILNPVYYLNNPIEIFNIRGGGLSIHGGLLVGICVLIFLAKKHKLGILKLLDIFAVGTALAQSIGRWGNFFNSEAYGYPTNLPWKLYIPLNHRIDIYSNYEYFHPTFLYESILDLCLFLGLFFILKHFRKKFEGLIFCLYLICYALIRFFVESLRIDSAFNVGSIPIAQIISCIMFVIGIFGLIFIIKKSNNTSIKSL